MTTTRRVDVLSTHNTSTVYFGKHHLERVVRSQRQFRGKMVGAVHDSGFLVLVEKIDDTLDSWRMIRVIRQLEENTGEEHAREEKRMHQDEDAG